uniref:POPLD domain-containing protein n=1 Tax=Caenorhabditis tropicalis TaxID=1561998 RepID=A0A1I7U969_9PELO
MDISRPVVEKPKFISVEKFVEARTNSIVQLLKAIDNDALVSGEVTKGPRTAAQRLPRHMRRRAMAYDIECTDAYSKVCEFSRKECRGRTSRGEEEECHQLYTPGEYPFGYIGPARFQKTSNENELNVWIHPSSKPQFLKAFSEFHGLKKTENEEMDQFKSSEMTVSIDIQHVARFHLSGPKCLKKLRDSIRFVEEERFQGEHDRFLSVADSVFNSNRDGEVIYLLIEDPRTNWDRKSDPDHKKVKKEEEIDWRGKNKPVNDFWNREFREKAVEKRMSDAEYQKKNADKILGVVSTEAKIPILLIIRNEGLKALDGVDILIPEPFSKDFWVSLQRRGVRASGLRDEYAAHLESKTLYFPIDDVESEAGRASGEAMKKELQEKYDGKPHNRRCKHWSALRVKYPFEYKWNELVKNWEEEEAEKRAFVCRDLQKLREIQDGLMGRSEIRKQENGMLIPVKLQFFGRGRPKKFGMICIPSMEDLISIRRNRNKEIIQKTPDSDEIIPMEVEEFPEGEEEVPRKRLEGFVSLDAAANEKPISLKWLFEETTRLDDRTTKRKRVNRKKKESKKRRKLEYEKRKEELASEEAERETTNYRFSANREIIGRLVAGEQSVLAGHGQAIGYICAAALSRIASNYHKTKTVVLVRNSTSKYYHPAYVTILKTAIQI